MSARPVLNVGVLGFGRMGQMYARILSRELPDARAFAIAEPDAGLRDKARSEYASSQVVASQDDLLALTGLDAVVIATPTVTHPAAIITAVRAGKPVFCEKPLALALRECREIQAAVSKAGVQFQLGFMRRFDQAYQEAKRRIEAGEIGQPILFKGVGRDDACPRPHYADPAKSGGLIVDMGIHDIDLARWLMGSEIMRVSAMGGLLVCKELAAVGDIDNAVVNLTYANGALGNLDISRNACYGYDIRHEVLGSAGTIVVGAPETRGLLYVRTEGGGDGFVLPNRFDRAYVAQLEHFVDCVRHDRMPSVTAEDGLEAARVAAAAVDAYNSGKTLDVSDY